MSAHRELIVETAGRGFSEITQSLHQFVRDSGLETGLLHLFIQHTSASLIICENADPDVLLDLNRYMDDLVPDGDRRFIHIAEGPDDMAAHIRSVLTATSLSIPVHQGRLQLGTWQGVFVWEHRYRPHRRSVVLTAL